MGKNGWQERIFRAKTLAHDYPFAAEILNFYCTLAEFQERLYQRIDRASAVPNSDGVTGVSPVESAPTHLGGAHSEAKEQSPPPLVAGPPELSMLLASFPDFLALVEKNGPPHLADAARQLRSAPLETQTKLLN